MEELEEKNYRRLLAEVGDENLLWHGSPAGGIRLRKSDAALIPFSLIITGFLFFCLTMALTSDRPVLLALLVTPFLLAGFYLLAGRFFYDAWRRDRTLYGVTDRRVIYLTNGKVSSLPLAGLPEVTVTEHKDGSGTIGFGMVKTGDGSDWPPDSPFSAWPDRKPLPQLEFVSAPRRVQEIIAGARGKAGK